jgi:MFS family permease
MAEVEEEPVSTNSKDRLFFGWRVVLAVVVLAMFGWGFGFYGPPIFLHAVGEAHGWSLALVSTAVTVHFLFGAIVIANLPKLYKRFGVATVTKAGSIALAIGTIGWAVAREPWQLFLATLLSGGGWVTMGAAAVNAIVSPWFIRARPAALASAYNGSSVGGVVFSPLWVAAIGLLGFPGAAIAIGLVMVVAIWILADLFYSKTPDQVGLVADGDVPGTTSVSITSPNAKALPGRQLSGAIGISLPSQLEWLSASSHRSDCWLISSRCLFRRSARSWPALRPARPQPPRSRGGLSLAG